MASPSARVIEDAVICKFVADHLALKEHVIANARGISCYSPHVLPSLGSLFSSWRRELSLIPVAAAVSLTAFSS
jgi:hypothetical protein